MSTQDARGRCIVCGTEHSIDRNKAVSEVTGKPTAPVPDDPGWEHTSDGMEATVCNDCAVDDPERVIAAYRLLTLTNAVVIR